MNVFRARRTGRPAPIGAVSLVAAAALVLLTQQPLHAGVDYQEAGSTTVPPGVDDVSVVCAVGNVDNTALGTDRRLIITFDVSLSSGNGDDWFAVSVGHPNDTAPAGTVWSGMFSEADALALARTKGSAGAAPHALYFNNRVDSLTFNPPSTNESASVRVTVDLSAAGIAIGERAFIRAEIDNDSDGAYDATGSAYFTWDVANTYICFGSRGGSRHVYSNLTIRSTSLPSTSFTLDFEHPDGTGSDYPDAISLNTVGSMKDKNGASIGFTHSTQSGGGAIEKEVELTDDGLVFRTDPVTGEVALGVPFATDSMGSFTITARFDGSFGGWDANFELTGILLGSAATRGLGNPKDQAIGGHALLTWYQNGNYRQSLSPDPWGDSDRVHFGGTSGSVTSMALSGTTVPGSVITGAIVSASSGTAQINDGVGWPTNHLGRSDAYAYFFAASSLGNGFTGTLKSITFAAPNLAVPAVGGPPASSFTLDFAHHDGKNSDFADAIALNTVGAIKDANGAPIGFTVNRDGGGQEFDVTLEADGLAFTTVTNATYPDRVILLGVPFATDCAATGTVVITARFDETAFGGWDRDFELAGVLLGDAESTGLSDSHSLLGIHHSSRFAGVGQAMCPEPWSQGRTDLPSYTDDENIREMVLSGVTEPRRLAWGAITAISNATAVVKANRFVDGYLGTYPSHMGQVDSHAYFYAATSSGDGFTGKLTSITFMAPNLVVIRPPTGTLFLFR
jgi:hypothetical protein